MAGLSKFREVMEVAAIVPAASTVSPVGGDSVMQRSGDIIATLRLKGQRSKVEVTRWKSGRTAYCRRDL